VPLLLVEDGQPRAQASGIVAGHAGQAGVAGRFGIGLPLLGQRFVGRVAQHGENLVEVLVGLIGAAGALGGLGQAGQQFAAQVHGQAVYGRGLLFPEQLIGVISLRPGGGAVLFGQAVGKEDVAAPGHSGDAPVVRAELTRLGKEVEHAAMVLLKFGGVLLLVGNYGAVKSGARLPGQQLGFGFGPFLQQDLHVLFTAREPFHIVGQEPGKNVFTHKGVNRQAGV
jgi:hypothetical protein